MVSNMKFKRVRTNHRGNLDLTYELIRQLHGLSANIVKFQLGWRADPGEMNDIDENES